MKSFRHLIGIIVLVGLFFQLTACNGTNASGRETWSLVEIVTKGDRVDTFTDTVKVKNCGIVQPETITCSAGEIKDLNVSLAGGVNGENIPIDRSVSTGLGIGRESGQNIELEMPPDGFAYIFTVNKEYLVTTGDLIAQSSSGEKLIVSYSFNASCSIEVVSKKQVSCFDPTQTPTLITPTYAPNPTQVLQSAFEVIDRQFEQSFTSHIVYNVQDTMNLNDTITIDLLLNPVLSTDELSTEIVQRGNFVTSTAQPGELLTMQGNRVEIVSQQIEVTDRMKASLKSVDAGAFIIEEVHDNPEQVISLKDTTKWRWHVTAQKEGTQILELVIYRLLKYDGKEYWREVESYSSNIVIKIPFSQRIIRWDWRWILGFIIPGILAIFWRWLENKKRKSNLPHRKTNRKTK